MQNLVTLLYSKFECSYSSFSFKFHKLYNIIVINIKNYFINITSYVSLLKLAGEQIQYLKSLHSICLIFRSM